ncbi:unnamed protein product [Urochloa decumbens]|uniref:F-box domain-containing protein n=1 Tax=Urochloa decumbens TaxID=240449 RepID=A0ABC8W9V3_9POAL
MAASAARRIAAAPAADPPFPDEILEEIFLRLGGAADLARACAACASFRRVITARPFLRRFRSLHAPPALGFLNTRGFHPASPPHRSAPAAAALARDADFDFSFLPEPRLWTVADARGGAVLLSRPIPDNAEEFAELVVCDPLYRRYVLVPPIPDDLASSVKQRDRWRFFSFLAPPAGEHDDGDDKEEGDRSRSFSLICAAVDRKSKAVAFVFRSGGGNGNWQRVANHSSSSRSPPLPRMLFHSDLHERSYAHGCFYWIVDPMGRSCYSLVLDTRDMKFTDIDLHLPRLPRRNYPRAIVDAGEGMLGLLTFGGSAIRLFRRTRRNDDASVGAEEWQLYRTAPLPKNCNGKDYDGWFTGGAADVYSLVLARESRSSWQYHTLELKTLLFERLYVSDHTVVDNHLYVRFPPLLAPPCI